MTDEPPQYTEDPILPEITPPPPGRIQVRGAQLMQIFDSKDRTLTIGGKTRKDGGREAVALAWARIPDGGWAVLLAWTSYARIGLQATALARWGWYRLDRERVEPKPAPRTLNEGAAWHGWHAESELHKAVLKAVRLLPGHLRELAIKPRPSSP